MGNICRSPMAEGIMRDFINTYNLDAEVDSAGTINFHQGEMPDMRAVNKSLQHEINIRNLKARPFVDKDFRLFDKIFVMDLENLNDIIYRAKKDVDKEKVSLIMSELYKNEVVEVPDPYYGGDQDFENVFQMLYKACEAIAKKIDKK